jgi:hypothetical protein
MAALVTSKQYIVDKLGLLLHRILAELPREFAGKIDRPRAVWAREAVG